MVPESQRGGHAPGLVRDVAAFLVGLAVGAGTAAGSARLLYTGSGFLATAGFLLAVSVAALAAGYWVGAPENEAAPPPSSGRRWLWLFLAFIVAAGFGLLWDTRPALRATALGGAAAVLLILAEPAYVSGSLLATLHVRGRAQRGPAGTAVAAMLGAAAGLVISTTLLIPYLAAPAIYFGAAGLLAITGGIEAARRVQAATSKEKIMRDRVAIVTGVGNRGQVGFAIARRFLEAGCKLVITGHSASVHELAGELAGRGQVQAIQADLTEPADVQRVIDAAHQRFGRLDAVVNVAGGLSVIKPLAETETEEWRREIQRNADTTYHMCRAALPSLRESRGAIVNFAAPAGERAVPNLAAYSAGKAAVVALTRALALEEREHGLRVNAIAPGLIDTEQNRKTAAEGENSRYVTREEIAEVVLFLAGPASSGISGETIHVMGEALQ
ncbi:MAG: SDR family NAD(P)-dependent oxidoreductase [Longimicrobiales bacterium]